MVTEVKPKLTVLDPTSGPVVDPVKMAPAMKDLSGKTVGLLANGKAGSVELLDLVAQLLEEKFSNLKFVRRTKPNVSRPVPDDMAAELIAQCQLVITATGD